MQKQKYVRRDVLLASLSTAGLLALPKSWTKPIVDTVILPSHAQTSASLSCSIALSDISINPDNQALAIRDTFTVQGEINVMNFSGSQAILNAEFTSAGSQGGVLSGSIFELNAGGVSRFVITGLITLPDLFFQTTVFTSLTLSVQFSGVADDGMLCELSETVIVPINVLLVP